jgi:creatinine amidohydrolase
MNWQEVEQAAQDGAIIIFPTGVVEEHGPHMGLGPDVYLTYIKCKLIRRELEARGIKTLIAPPYYWGINKNSGGFPGSFTVRKETMKAVLYDTLACFKRWGFPYVFVLNHHGDEIHNRAILEAVYDARIDAGVRAYFILNEFDAKVRYRLTGREEHIILIPRKEETGPRPKYMEIHAGGRETGAMMYYFPDQVDSDLARTLKPTNLVFKDLMAWDPGWDDARKITPLGYFGDPAGFDPDKSHESMKNSVKKVSDLIENFLKKREP